MFTSFCKFGKKEDGNDNTQLKKQANEIKRVSLGREQISGQGSLREEREERTKGILPTPSCALCSTWSLMMALRL